MIIKRAGLSVIMLCMCLDMVQDWGVGVGMEKDWARKALFFHTPELLCESSCGKRCACAGRTSCCLHEAMAACSRFENTMSHLAKSCHII